SRRLWGAGGRRPEDHCAVELDRGLSTPQRELEDRPLPLVLREAGAERDCGELEARTRRSSQLQISQYLCPTTCPVAPRSNRSQAPTWMRARTTTNPDLERSAPQDSG